MSGYLLPKDLQPRSDVKTTKENVKVLARVFKRSIKLGLVHSYSPLIIDVMDEIVSSKGKCKFETDSRETNFSPSLHRNHPLLLLVFLFCWTQKLFMKTPLQFCSRRNDFFLRGMYANCEKKWFT